MSIGKERVRCRIQRYDPDVKEAPLSFITLGEFTVEKSKANDGGVHQYHILADQCQKSGYHFKFYSESTDKKNFQWDLTVE
jgi:hypothetical protein